jgi:hypothetical protein
MTENDAVAVATIKTATGLDYSAGWQRQGQAWDLFVDEMWAAYRNHLPLGVAGPGGTRAEQFLLLQNYPNPFNPTTVVSYQLSAVSDVRLIVYDVLGREVAILVNEKKVPGTYDIRFDGANLAAGVYICRLMAGQHIESRYPKSDVQYRISELGSPACRQVFVGPGRNFSQPRRLLVLK